MGKYRCKMLIETLGDLKHKLRNDIEASTMIELEVRSLFKSQNPELVHVCVDRVIRFRDRLIERLGDVETIIDKTEEENG
jgi:hypothetical protein